MADLLCAAVLNIRVKRYISRNRARGANLFNKSLQMDFLTETVTRELLVAS